MIETRTARERLRREFHLGWALGLSIVVHLLLAGLLSLVGSIPFVRAATVAQNKPEDSVVQFTFAQAPEPQKTAEKPSAPAGEIPFQKPAPRPSADLSPPPPDPGSVSPPVPPGESHPAAAASEARGERERAAGQEAAEAGVEGLPPDPQAANRQGTEGSRGRNGGRDFDLQGAIRDFGRALDRARADSAPEQSGSGPPRNVFVPDPVDLPTTGFGVGNLTFETRDFDWEDYARSIYWEIWRAWHNRLLRLASDFERWSYDTREPNLYHQAQIRFVIERTGEVTGIAVELPSGCPPLDDSATQALAEVILPALPDAFPKQREVVHARFLAQGEVRALRPHLERLKALNYF